MNKKKSKSAVKGHILAGVITLISLLVADYVMLFPYNIQSPTTWGLVVVVILVFLILDWIFTSNVSPEATASGSITLNSDVKFSNGYRKYIFFGVIGIAAVGLIIYGYSSTVFHAKTYAKIAGETIETRNFIEDVAPSESIADIALMDTEGAQILGARALGTLSDLVSQFEINNVYTQINLAGKPKKVTPLEYADFFKYLANMSTGIPGYISVDPVLNTSEYVKLEKPIYYGESAYFGQDLMRRLRFDFRWAMFGEVYFEIAEDGTPYYIASVMKHTVGLFGGRDIQGVVTLNASTGETAYYNRAEIPRWIDIVFSGAILTERYDWYGLLSGGFFNSIFANKDCKRITTDFGYKMFDDDVWVFTGVTSLASDQSNIGFVLMNSRTGEIRYYAIPGAEEYSVMRSAEGEVQHLGYRAAFPSVINIDNQPTYIMVLKDKGSLVKQYALIHVERYNIVVTASTQKEAISKYRAALATNGIVDSEIEYEDPNSVKITVSDIKFLTVEGSSWVYIISSDAKLYKCPAMQDEKIIMVKPGDKIEVSVTQESEGVFSILSFTK